jgi:hypothetical protein
MRVALLATILVACTPSTPTPAAPTNSPSARPPDIVVHVLGGEGTRVRLSIYDEANLVEAAVSNNPQTGGRDQIWWYPHPRIADTLVLGWEDGCRNNAQLVVDTQGKSLILRLYPGQLATTDCPAIAELFELALTVSRPISDIQVVVELVLSSPFE